MQITAKNILYCLPKRNKIKTLGQLLEHWTEAQDDCTYPHRHGRCTGCASVVVSEKFL